MNEHFMLPWVYTIARFVILREMSRNAFYPSNEDCEIIYVLMLKGLISLMKNFYQVGVI